MRRVDSLEKTLMLGGIGGRRRRGWQRMRWLDGITDSMGMETHGGWTPGVGDGQGGQACCGSWGRKELDTTEQLNWTELKPLTTLLVFPSFYFFKYQDNKMVSFLGTLWELFKIYTEVEFFWWGSMFASASVLWRQAIHSHFKLTYLFGFFRSQK